MRCKPDVANPTGCRAASCRFFVVFCRFFAVSSRLPRRPLLLSSPPSAPPVFSADRSSRLPRRPLLLSSPPTALVFSAVPSSLFPRALPLRPIILYYCAPFRSAPFRERRRSVFCPSPRPPPLPSRRLFPPAASSLPRLFPLAPLPSRASSLPRLARAPSAPRFRLLATYFSVIGLTESEIFP